MSDKTPDAIKPWGGRFSEATDAFVERFTAQNKGKAFLTGLSDLGQMIFEDYEKNRIKRI